MIHVENDTNEESNQTIKRTRKVHGVIEYIVKQFQKYFVPGKNIAIDELTVWFNGKIIFEIYNPKYQRSGASDYLHLLQNKSIRPSKRQESTWDDKTYTEKMCAR
jgi:hypothetical protein